jgi:hypothetical protein
MVGSRAWLNKKTGAEGTIKLFIFTNFVNKISKSDFKELNKITQNNLQFLKSLYPTIF